MKRIEWIDMAKGYGIICVILGHYEIPYIEDVIYSFHIPMFILLSGVFFSTKKNLKEFIKSKIQKIIIPYIFLCIPMIIFGLLLRNKQFFTVEQLTIEIKLFIMQRHWTTLWYLACLFNLNILTYLVIKIHSLFYRFSIIIFSSIIGIIYFRSGMRSLPWAYDITLVVWPFFYLGYYIRPLILSESIFKGCNIIYKSKIFWSCIYIFFFLFIINMKLEGKHIDLFCSNFKFEPIAYLDAVLGTYIICVCSKKRLSRIISYIGRNSLVFFAWHQTLIMTLLDNILNYFNVSRQGNIFISLLTIILNIICLFLLNEIIIRTKLKVLIGR